jgi:hypothetical protein
MKKNANPGNYSIKGLPEQEPENTLPRDHAEAAVTAGLFFHDKIGRAHV